MNSAEPGFLPLVTIGIPTYNQGKYIAEAVESALAMDYPNLEVIVADDGTTPFTEQLLKKYTTDHRFRYIRNERNVGRTANYRRLLYEYARGVWYLNLDGDDYYTDPSFISEAIHNISNIGAENVVLYQASSFVENVDGNRVIKSFAIANEWELMNGRSYFIHYLRYGSVQHLSALYNRKKAMELDFYRSPALRSDLESLLRLCLRGQIILQKKPVGVWRDHGNNETWLLDEASLEQEIKVYDAVAADAKQFLGPDPTQQWKDKSVDHLTRYYLDSLITKKPSFNNWKIFTRRGKFSYAYIKLFVKFLLFSSGLFKIEK